MLSSIFETLYFQMAQNSDKGVGVSQLNAIQTSIDRLVEQHERFASDCFEKINALNSAVKAHRSASRCSLLHLSTKLLQLKRHLPIENEQNQKHAKSDKGMRI